LEKVWSLGRCDGDSAGRRHCCLVAATARAAAAGTGWAAAGRVSRWSAGWLWTGTSRTGRSGWAWRSATGVGPFGPFGRELNLTDDQRAQIQKIQQSFQQGDQALHEQMRALVEGRGDPLSSEFNEAAVRSAAEARAKIQVEMEVSHARMMSQMLGVLTAEQRAQLAARHTQMREQGPPRPPQPPADQPFF